METLLSMGKTKADISNILCVHRSTVYREVKRNSLKYLNVPEPTYDGSTAQLITDARRKDAGDCRRAITGKALKYMKTKLKLRWSPEQIAGRYNLERRRQVMSYSSIYRYIVRDAEDYWNGKRLYKYLRRYPPKRRRRTKPRKLPLGYGSPRLCFRERPVEAERRTELGHFERDLMEGQRGKQAVLVIADRKSRFVLLDFVTRDAKRVQKSTIKLLKKRLVRKVKSKTITNDNGHEFIYSRLRKAQKELGVPIYFTDPHSPWQRGTVENMIGLIREYFPKKLDLTKVTIAELKRVETLLNQRPRKILKYKTPLEIFSKKRKV